MECDPAVNELVAHVATPVLVDPWSVTAAAEQLVIDAPLSVKFTDPARVVVPAGAVIVAVKVTCVLTAEAFGGLAVRTMPTTAGFTTCVSGRLLEL